MIFELPYQNNNIECEKMKQHSKDYLSCLKSHSHFRLSSFFSILVRNAYFREKNNRQFVHDIINISLVVISIFNIFNVLI